MDLSQIYAKGTEFFSTKEYGRLLDYVETGFVARNDRRVLDRYTFRQRCIDAVEADCRYTILEPPLETPVIMSAMTMPIPAMGDDAILQVAEGLKAAGSLMWTGTPIPKNLKELVATGVPVAANVKPLSDRKQMQADIDRILTAGVTWLGLEIDAAQGTKIRDQEMGIACAPLSLPEIVQIKQRSTVPVACKGVLSGKDAKKCIEAGVDIIVVSSHGGHTLDYLPHPLQVMDEIRDVVQGRCEIVVDGGFRRGSDILKGLACGASLVGLGRPILYALAVGGQQGVTDLIQGITRELKRLMTMVGAVSLDDISRAILIEEK